MQKGNKMAQLKTLKITQISSESLKEECELARNLRTERKHSILASSDLPLSPFAPAEGEVGPSSSGHQLNGRIWSR